MASSVPFRGRSMAKGVHHLVATRELTALMRQIRSATGDTRAQSCAVLNATLTRAYPNLPETSPGSRYSVPHQVTTGYLSKVERGANATLPVPEALRAQGMDERSDAARGSAVPPWLVWAYDVAFGADGFLIDAYSWAMALLADQQHNPPRVTRELPVDVPGGTEDDHFAAGFQGAPGHIREVLRDHARELRERAARPAAESAWVTDPADESGGADDDADNPNGVVVRPGEFRVVRWAMRNAGSVPWRDRWLYRVWRPGIGIVTPGFVPLPDTDPGGTAQIRCPFRAPLRPGTYRMCLKAGWPNGVYCYPGTMLGLPLTITVPPADLADCHEPWT
ncbi:MAG TPA: hypothetical protein VFX16_08490 [Pseudonocardiaceae bacterium]|nr:hypothetical protein [Pseudonocardiaceae bacterium]